MKYLNFILMIVFLPFLIYGQRHISVTSAILPVLYLECNNPIHIEIADKCEGIEIACIAENADITEDSVIKSRFWLRPHKESCSVFVYKKMDCELLIIDTLAYMAQEPPLPHLVFKNDTQQIVSGCIVKRGSIIKVEIIPDTHFAQAFPQEVNYCFDGFEKYWVSNGIARRGCSVPLAGRPRNNKLSLPTSPGETDGYIYELRICRLNSAKVRFPIQLESSETYFSFMVEK